MIEEGQESLPRTVSAAHDDADVVARVRSGEIDAFEVLMRAHNRRLFRIVRGLVADDAEAEDVCQEAWILAYTRLETLRDGQAFGKWLGRIGVRCALGRRKHVRDLDTLDRLDAMQATGEPPERQMQRKQIAEVLEHAIDRLPPSLRTVILLRDVEQASTAETAEILGLTEQNVRVRLHRARAHLREDLTGELAVALEDVFRFERERCDRFVAAVMPKLRALAQRRRSDSDDRFDR